ncbi:MAG: S8 family serine peptidase [Candidatus Njordarchaeum guaymaensis]
MGRKIAVAIFILIILFPQVSHGISASNYLISSQTVLKSLNKSSDLIRTIKVEKENLDDPEMLISSVDKNHNRIYDSLEQSLKLHPDKNFDVIVILRDDPQGVINHFRMLGGDVKYQYSNAFCGFSGEIMGRNLYDFARDDRVLLIQPNFIYRATTINTTRIIRVRPYVWDTLGYYGSSNFSIAIIDSGIDPTHPMTGPFYGDGNFSGKIVGWYDSLNSSKTEPYDDNGHGTLVASVTAGNEYAGNLDSEGRISVRFFDFGFIMINFNDIKPNQIRNYSNYLAILNPGNVEIYLNWSDISIQGPNIEGHNVTILGLYVYGPNGELVASNESDSKFLTIKFNASELGLYNVKVVVQFHFEGDDPDSDTDGAGVILNGWAKLRYSSPDTHQPFSGVAPGFKLVGVKVLDRNGEGLTEKILQGIDWILNNTEKYHIVVATITLGTPVIDPAVELAITNLAKSGIVVASAAGNAGPNENTIYSPSTSDYVISVAASNTGWFSGINVTHWSSKGPYGKYDNGSIAYRNTIKPDITAPGGDFGEPSVISADNNYDDNVDVFKYSYPLREIVDVYKSENITEHESNDFVFSVGTSIAAAHIGGVVALMIQMLTNGNYSQWNYTLNEVLEVKKLLLMSGWELIAPSANERGKKDASEGFGLVQADAAMEAYLNEIEINKPYVGTLTSETLGKHVWARKIYLEKGKGYIFILNQSETADFDLFVFSEGSNNWGEPILLSRSASPILGKSEYVGLYTEYSGYYYVLIKAYCGSGDFTLKIIEDTQIPEIRVLNLQNGTEVPPYPNLTIQLEVIDDVPETMNLTLFVDNFLVRQGYFENVTLPLLSPGNHIVQISGVDPANNNVSISVSFTAMNEELESFSASPPSGSILEPGLHSITVEVAVKYSYVTNVRFQIGGGYVNFELFETKNNVTVWKLNLELQGGEYKARIIIQTPVADLGVDYKLQVIPFLTAIIFGSVGIVIGVSIYAYTRYKRRRKLKIIERASEIGEQIANEILDEILSKESEGG